MSSQRYERVLDNDHDDTSMTPDSPHDTQHTPSSPPPSFRSRASSPSSRRLLDTEDPIATDAERTLNDTFDDGSDSDEEGDGGDDRQRLMRSNTTQSSAEQRTGNDGNRPQLSRAVTQLPIPETPAALGAALAGTPRPHSGGPRQTNDGVFGNLDAKPERGEKLEEQPPSYEAAAADATPPYWETTILAPNHLSATDEVYVDGLPVGSLFSFVWNAMISMSFSLVGFLLTYLLHTTHAAKNGSRAGLGVTLVQYGFYMRAGPSSGGGGGGGTIPSDGGSNGDSPFTPPQDPNNHDFDPSAVSDSAAAAAAAALAQGTPPPTSAGGGLSSTAGSNWLAYCLMIVGWFILIRSVSDFIKARRHEQLVLQSPDRGLNVPVVADSERPEAVV